MKDWAKRYKDTYNEIADYSSPSAYDAVHLLKAAVEKANSLDHTAIAKAIETTTLDQNTMCATTYKMDDRHQLSHQAVVMKFEGGVPTQVKAYTAADLVGHGAVQA